MGTYGLLTILAISIAGYRALSDEKRFDIHIRFAWYDWLVLGLSVAVVLYVVYIPVLDSLELLIPLPWMFGFDENTTSFSALLVIIFYLGIKISKSRVPDAKVATWERYADRLLQNKQYKELAYLFDRYHLQILSAISRDTWFVRFHHWLAPAPILNIIIDVNLPPPSKNRFIRGLAHQFDRFRRGVASLFPKESKKSELLKLTVSNLLRSRSFIEFMIETHPMVLMKATEIRFRGDEEFINTLFSKLISMPEGPLYRELRDNQSCDSQHKYYLNEGNQLLYFLFNDVSVAKKLSVWKPIGERVLEFISSNKGKENIYNESCDRFSSGDEQWGCPIFVACFFFDIMVSSAIHQREKNHMWLLYFNDFAEAIFKVIDNGDSVDTVDEFPNRYDYLIYNMISTCKSWVLITQYIDYKNLSLEDIRSYPEFWAASCLGRLLRQVLNGNQTDKQKVYYLGIVVGAMRDLDSAGLKFYAKEVINSCLIDYKGASIDLGIKSQLTTHYLKVDHVLKSNTSTFEVTIT